MSLAVSLWFENQPDIDFTDHVPTWARQAAQAHMDQSVRVVAHEDSAYARAGLSCQVMKSGPWVDDDVVGQVVQRVSNARATPAAKVILILPARAPAMLWAQWMLYELPQHGAGLDEVLVLMQLDKLWDNLPDGAALDRLLLADRVLSFDGDVYKADFVPYMRAVNPLAAWLHEGFENDADIVNPITAYANDAPLWREAIKKADLDAWGARKVVYLSFDLSLSARKLRATLESWRVLYGDKLVRFQAIVYLKGESSPLCIQALHHLWADDFVSFWQITDMPRTQMWLWGNDLPAVQMQSELEGCAAQAN